MPSPDPLNYCVVRVQSMFEDVDVSNATGFFYSVIEDGKPTLWLITNWHVVSGRNASNPEKILHSKCALPSRLKIEIPSWRNGDITAPPGQLFFQTIIVDIYDARGEALWHQHREKNSVDIAGINLGHGLTETLVRGLNEFANESDMAIEIGNDVFILGYPLGFSHFLNTPIWKRGSIASEPHAETPESRGKIMIDATTRSGMSGSPVIMRAKTHYLSESGDIKCFPNATRFIGVYASRPAPPGTSESRDGSNEDEDKRHELGYVFKSGFVPEIIQNGMRGSHFGEVP